MAHAPEVRNQVRTAYVRNRLTLEQAAELAGISHYTARNWKRKDKAEGDCWDRARQAHRMSEGGAAEMTAEVLELFAGNFTRTMEQLQVEELDPVEKVDLLTKLADAYTKVMRAAGGGDKTMARLALALEVLQHQEQFIAKHFPQHRAAFGEILEPLGVYLNEVLPV